MDSDCQRVDSNAGSKDKQEDKLPEFDPDLSPCNCQNRRAAVERRIVFSRGCYRDVSGAMVRDRFGQPY